MPELNPDLTRAPSKIVRRFDCYARVADEIRRGLNGEMFRWNGTEGKYNCMWAADMGINLVTKNWIKKHGYRLKRRVAPVGSRYFGGRIGKQRFLYVLECQAVRLDPPGEDPDPSTGLGSSSDEGDEAPKN